MAAEPGFGFFGETFFPFPAVIPTAVICGLRATLGFARELLPSPPPVAFTFFGGMTVVGRNKDVADAGRNDITQTQIAARLSLQVRSQ